MTTTDIATTREAWERLPNETPQAFHAFNLYRNLPPPRTIRQAAELTAETTRKKGSVETIYTRLRMWASKHDWQERVDAFDLMLDRQRLAARETERQRIDREHMLEGRYLRSAAITRFTGGQDQQGREIEAIDWNTVDTDSALAAYRLGISTERQAAGLAVGSTLGMTPTNHARQVLEELFQLALTFIPEDRRQAFAQRAQALGETSAR